VEIFRSIAKKSPSGICMFWKLKKTLHTQSLQILLSKLRLWHPTHCWILEPIWALPTRMQQWRPCVILKVLMWRMRARFLMGYAVYGDAILANIGSTWDSQGKCVYGDVTLNNYHRSVSPANILVVQFEEQIKAWKTSTEIGLREFVGWCWAGPPEELTSWAGKQSLLQISPLLTLVAHSGKVLTPGLS